MMVSRLTALTTLAVPLMAGSFTSSVGDPAASKAPARGAIAHTMIPFETRADSTLSTAQR
jgi:hypothetical protein